MSAGGRRDARLLIGSGIAVVALATGSTVAVEAATGQFETHRTTPSAACTAPTLAGAQIDVSLSDMHGMMRGGQMGWRTWRAGMMRVDATPTSVPHGTVSLRVTNVGVIAHELVVLPLPAGRAAGWRPVGRDGSVDETGSLGEVSRSCGAGLGDGVAAGATGWTTLTLPTGRYELLCNLPGHYAAGMFTELDVS